MSEETKTILNASVAPEEFDWDAFEEKGTVAEDREKVAELYAEMIAINNRIAKIAGYDNYLAYAYANDYGRTYSPEDVSAMRAYVKEYLSPYFIYLLYAQYLYEPYDEEIDDYPEWCYLFSAGADESIFDSGLATDLAAAYLKTVGTIGEREMSVYETVNDVFRNNNYFLGAYDAAYTSRLSHAPEDRQDRERRVR